MQKLYLRKGREAFVKTRVWGTGGKQGQIGGSGRRERKKQFNLWKLKGENVKTEIVRKLSKTKWKEGRGHRRQFRMSERKILGSTQTSRKGQPPDGFRRSKRGRSFVNKEEKKQHF